MLLIIIIIIVSAGLASVDTMHVEVMNAFVFSLIRYKIYWFCTQPKYLFYAVALLMCKSRSITPCDVFMIISEIKIYELALYSWQIWY